MANQEAIAFWSVERAVPLAVKSERSGSQSQLKTGTVVEARVAAVPAKNVAQLEILGQILEVTTPRPLEIGSTIKVAIHRSGGDLELIVQPDAEKRTAPQPDINLGPSTIDKTIDGLKSDGLGFIKQSLAAQAVINEALLTADPTPRTTPPPFSEGSANLNDPAGIAAAVLSQTVLQKQIRTRYNMASSDEREKSLENSGLPASTSASPPSTISANAHHFAANTVIVVPLHVPPMQHPVSLRIEREEEDEDKDGRPSSGPAKNRWTAKVSLDAGSIGRIHAVIGLCAGAVSVNLAVEDAPSAPLVKAWLPALKSTLEQADFTVDDLDVRQTVATESVASWSEAGDV